MTRDEILTVALTIFSALFLPALAFIIRGAVKWTRVESKLEDIAKDLVEIVRDKDRTHNEIISTMRDDRAATDKRLRWLEENVWNQERTKGNAL